MSYTVESLNGCTKKLIFNFEQVDLTKQINAALIEKQRESNLKGFRKGKAPLTMVKQFYGPQIENDALYRFVSEQFYDALKKENLRTVGYPTFGQTDYEPGKKVSFEATVEIFPEIKIKDFSHYVLNQDSETVSAKELEDLRKSYLASKAEVVELTENLPLEMGQFAVMNFEGQKSDGTKPDNMKRTEYMLEMGSGQFIAGFEQGMIGMKKGEKKTLNLNFPTDYHEETLKGQPVTFEVELLEIKVKKLPELSDELVKEIGFASLNVFNEQTESYLKNKKKQDSKSKLQQEFLEKLINDNLFDIPSALLQEQKQAVKSDLSKTLSSQGFDQNMMDLYFDKWDQDMEQKALFQVRSGLILDTLAKNYNIEVTDSDFEAKLEEMVQDSPGAKKEDILRFYKSNAQVKKNMMYGLREQLTFDKIFSIIKVTKL